MTITITINEQHTANAKQIKQVKNLKINKKQQQKCFVVVAQGNESGIMKLLEYQSAMDSETFLKTHKTQNSSSNFNYYNLAANATLC